MEYFFRTAVTLFPFRGYVRGALARVYVKLTPATSPPARGGPRAMDFFPSCI